MTPINNTVTYAATSKTPWDDDETTPAQETIDGQRYQSDIAAYNDRFGHVERRHAATARLHLIMTAVIAMLGGLIMALGFYPVVACFFAVFIIHSLEETVREQDYADRVRRSDYGLD